MYKSWVIAGIALAGAALGSSAHATAIGPPSAFYINYDITLPAYPVSDMVLFEQGAPNPNPNGYGITFGGCCDYAGVGTTVITDPFVKTNPIISNFILGVASHLAGDPAGQQHLVVFTNDSFAAGAQGVDFGTLFPNTNETTLINDLTTNLDQAAVGDTVYNQAINDLFTFAAGDAKNAGIGFGSASSFSAVAFSSGQTIGTGLSFTSPAPEPETWALLMLGIGLIGAAVRARRTASLAAA